MKKLVLGLISALLISANLYGANVGDKIKTTGVFALLCTKYFSNLPKLWNYTIDKFAHRIDPTPYIQKVSNGNCFPVLDGTLIGIVVQVKHQTLLKEDAIGFNKNLNFEILQLKDVEVNGKKIKNAKIWILHPEEMNIYKIIK